MNTKKSILFFHHSSIIGGAGISGLRVLKVLQKEYKITVYCFSDVIDMAELYKEAGFDVIYGGNSPVSFSHCVGGEMFALSPFAIRNYINVFRDKAKIFNVINSLNPDIVVTNSMTLFWIGKIAKKSGKETICFFRETYIKGLLGIRTSIIKYYLGKYFDKIAFISKYELNQSRNIKSKKTTIYNVIQPEAYNSFNKSKELISNGLSELDFHLLYVGGMSPLKGALVILKAMVEIDDPRIKLLFVGYHWSGKKKKLSNCKGWRAKVNFLLNRDYEKKCINIILRNKLEKKIVFFQRQKRITPFFAMSDAIVIPNTKPHQSRPIFEAGVARLPVIISDSPNIREVIDEESGFLFETNNYKQLSVIISEIYRNYISVRMRVDKNFSRTLNNHAPKVFATKILSFFRD